MDTMTDKPTIPEVLHLFVDYYRANPAWGALHIVLDDGNVRDGDVASAMEWAAEKGDVKGARLALILHRMSRSQRGRLDRKVCEALRAERAVGV